jgi:uncharacterized protein (DUF58 family)
MAASLTAWVRRRAGQWMLRRTAHDQGEVFLTQRRVYILPTRAGLGFGALLLVLLIGSVNYSLGLGFALTFTAASCAVVDMLFTYRNLAHLHLRPVRVQEVFAGEEAQFELRLVNRTRRARYAVRIAFDDTPDDGQALDIAPGAGAEAVLAAPTARRGRMAAPRVRLSTRFPLGLFRAWSYWQPDLEALVYPFPEPDAPPLPLTGGAGSEGGGHAGEDDFAGVRSYQAGDSLRRLAWRQIARLDPAYGGQLATKHFEGGALDQLVLDFGALPPGLDLELRLARMTRWVLDAEQRALPYAFRLGAQAFAAASGAAHRAACLRALALFGERERP